MIQMYIGELHDVVSVASLSYNCKDIIKPFDKLFSSET